MSGNQTNQLALGSSPLALFVQLKAGSVWRPTITQTDGVPTAQNPSGTPVNWPAGTTAQIVFTDGTPDSAFTVTYPGTVSGANISWSLSVAQASAIPDGSKAQVWVDQSGNGSAPDLFASGNAFQVG